MQQFSSTSYQLTLNDFEWGGGGPFIILKELYISQMGFLKVMTLRALYTTVRKFKMLLLTGN